MVVSKRFNSNFREVTPDYTSEKSLQRKRQSVYSDQQSIRNQSKSSHCKARYFTHLSSFALALSFILPDTSAAAEQGEVASVVSQKHIVALTGDTLWSIAQRVDPYGNITLLVDQLVIINGGTVTPGQKILLP
jgi:hypothetical protein